jgi:hypothetical protein
MVSTMGDGSTAKTDAVKNKAAAAIVFNLA